MHYVIVKKGTFINTFVSGSASCNNDIYLYKYADQSFNETLASQAIVQVHPRGFNFDNFRARQYLLFIALFCNPIHTADSFPTPAVLIILIKYSRDGICHETTSHS